MKTLYQFMLLGIISFEVIFFARTVYSGTTLPDLYTEILFMSSLATFYAPLDLLNEQAFKQKDIETQPYQYETNPIVIYQVELPQYCTEEPCHIQLKTGTISSAECYPGIICNVSAYLDEGVLVSGIRSKNLLRLQADEVSIFIIFDTSTQEDTKTASISKPHIFSKEDAHDGLERTIEPLGQKEETGHPTIEKNKRTCH